MSVLLETSCGDIVIDLYFDASPKACLNFLKLCKIKKYNDCQFFRVVNGFVAETGDPQNDGTGGASVFVHCHPPGPRLFHSEISAKLTHARRGTVSMTASQQSQSQTPMHASQFFITLAPNLQYLDGKHTVFGFVEEGMHVLDALACTPVDNNYRPFRELRIRHTVILHDPFDDPLSLPSRCQSPEPIQIVSTNRLPSDDDEDMTDYLATGDQRWGYLSEAQKEREARSRAEVLEMIGDIGDADLKPPENVLFICKLNPVTEAEDLDTIFSRFGKCQSDILRDKETSDSLCYGFITFESRDQCERAYFQMDNVLIDDRRVRVDFSQSVSKLWNRRHVHRPPR